MGPQLIRKSVSGIDRALSRAIPVLDGHRVALSPRGRGISGRQTVVKASGNGGHPTEIQHRHWREPVDGAAVTQLPGVVDAPGPHRAVTLSARLWPKPPATTAYNQQNF